MNNSLYLICKEYCKCYDVLHCLIHVDGLEAESLKLFRLTKDRTEQLEEEIITNTDFKKLYGANNQKIRDQHIKIELQDWHQIIKELEFSIDYIQRRISFLRQLTHTKTILMEVKRIPRPVKVGGK